jgi:hypothetical protein
MPNDLPTRIPRLAVEERYHRDEHFRQLVDVLTHFVQQLHLTPTELREAAVFACIRYETHIAREAVRYMRVDEGVGRAAAEIPYRVREEVLAHVHELESWLLDFKPPTSKDWGVRYRVGTSTLWLFMPWRGNEGQAARRAEALQARNDEPGRPASHGLRTYEAFEIPEGEDL